jgi:hypothetical protein
LLEQPRVVPPYQVALHDGLLPRLRLLRLLVQVTMKVHQLSDLWRDGHGENCAWFHAKTTPRFDTWGTHQRLEVGERAGAEVGAPPDLLVTLLRVLLHAPHTK